MKRKPTIIGALIIILLDQISKWWVMNNLMSSYKVIEVTPFFNIVSAWNKGVSFSMFQNESPYGPWLLSAIALVIVAGLIWWEKSEDDKRVKFAIGMIIGGAIGNVIDRVRFKAVYDFLDFYYMSYHWPAFNIADCGITIGATIIIALSLFCSDNVKKTETEE